MAAVAYLDTHVVAWLYAGQVDLIPPKTTALLDSGANLLISPMVQLELQYLYELKRVKKPAATVIDALTTELGLAVCDLPFSRIMAKAVQQNWTREPFDRLIVGHAAVRGSTLITKDDQIRRNYAHAFWK